MCLCLHIVVKVIICKLHVVIAKYIPFMFKCSSHGEKKVSYNNPNGKNVGYMHVSVKNVCEFHLIKYNRINA